MHKCISAELARLACNEEITHVTIAEATGWLDEHKKIDKGEGERAATVMAENKRQTEDGEIQESYRIRITIECDGEQQRRKGEMKRQSVS
jgi:hypothetical protein